MKYLNTYLYFIVYCIVLGYIVFIHGIRDRITVEIRDDFLNIIPFAYTYMDFSILMRYGLKGHTNVLYNTFGNILLFIPFSFLLICKNKGDHVFKIISLGIFVSATIECLQYIFLIGITDIDDLILNTLGLCIGAVLAVKYIRYFH
jgi:glycopeptide antibiotics resistance protein